MPKRLDLTGHTYGRLTVIRFAFTKNGKAHWKCLCKCGNETIVYAGNLHSGHTKSCGCLAKEGNQKTHGLTGHPAWRSWYTMMQRCYRTTNENYRWYGGRGIYVCKRWHTAKNFLDDMMPTWKPGLTLDKDIIKPGNLCYRPEYCRWVTMRQQNNNRRDNRLIRYNGETKTLAQWSRSTEINTSALHNRIKKGWSIEDILTKPIRGTSIAYDGKTLTIKE